MDGAADAVPVGPLGARDVISRVSQASSQSLRRCTLCICGFIYYYLQMYWLPCPLAAASTVAGT